MHQCPLCNPKYGNCFRTLWLFWVLCYTCGYQILCVVGDEMSVNLLCDGTIIVWVVRTYLVIGIGKFVGFFCIRYHYSVVPVVVKYSSVVILPDDVVVPFVVKYSSVVILPDDVVVLVVVVMVVLGIMGTAKKQY